MTNFLLPLVFQSETFLSSGYFVLGVLKYWNINEGHITRGARFQLILSPASHIKMMELQKMGGRQGGRREKNFLLVAGKLFDNTRAVYLNVHALTTSARVSLHF